MAKPESWRLDRASYPFSVPIQTRFGDMDFLGHINNVAYAAFFENGRGAFHGHIKTRAFRDKHDRSVIAAVEIAYLREGFHPDTIEVAAGVGRIGVTSYTVEMACFQNGVCIATCDTIIANQDGDHKSKPITEEHRRALESHATTKP